MAKARKHARQRKRAKSLIGSMQEFLTPAVFKQVRNASKRRKHQRWDLHPLLYILLLTTYCCGDSLPEKFEAARSFYVVCCPKRKRPGVSFAGFEKAVAKLPMPVLRTLTAAIRGQIKEVFADRWKVGNFIPFGCDGTRQACPRSEELERRLGTFGKEGSPPMIRQNVSFLIRMSSNATFYSESNEPLEEFREGIVYYWPKTQENDGKPHTAPHPPLLLMLTIEQKIKIHEHLQAA